MRPERWKKYAAGAGGMLVLVTAILLVTGWGSAVAANVSNIFVTNDAAHAVPVREQALDGNGNIKVHEQGTANVNVTNTSLPAAAPAPVTGGSGNGFFPPNQAVDSLGTQEATALQIVMTADVSSTEFEYNGTEVARFFGPVSGGPSTVALPLTRPLKFDSITCHANVANGEPCRITWIGNSP